MKKLKHMRWVVHSYSESEMRQRCRDIQYRPGYRGDLGGNKASSYSYPFQRLRSTLYSLVLPTGRAQRGNRIMRIIAILRESLASLSIELLTCIVHVLLQFCDILRSPNRLLCAAFGQPWARLR